MKRNIGLILLVSCALCVVGCQNAQTRTGEGAVIGGILGTVAGGIIGHNDDRHGAEGAAIGAATGAVAGALIGSQINKNPQGATQPQGVQAAQQAQVNNPNQMNIPQIIDLSKQGVNEAVIIDKIRITNSKFHLTADDVSYLKQQGVSQNVISVMQGL